MDLQQGNSTAINTTTITTLSTTNLSNPMLQMLEHIKEQHGSSLEYIMITGDYPAHDVWLQSRQHNLDTAKAVLQPLAQIFPETQVFPSLGNHEPFPCNM